MEQARRFWLAAWLVLPGLLLAHGDLHEQIENVTAQIRNYPQNAGLHLKRAELHRNHEDWPAAAADYDRAEKLGPALPGVHLGRGKMLLAMARFDEAQAELDKFLAAQPENVDALVTRGRIKARRAQPVAAAADFARAIELSPQPEPEFYLEGAQALASAGTGHTADALRILDEGIAKLGNVPVLCLYAIELEVQRKQFDAALAKRTEAATRLQQVQKALADFQASPAATTPPTPEVVFEDNFEELKSCVTSKRAEVIKILDAEATKWSTEQSLASTNRLISSNKINNTI